ncbi:MAG: ABC transporter ATP-binding protein [Acidobacteriota bacterium]|jgi:ABC-2 type transport system ATP-binding protein
MNPAPALALEIRALTKRYGKTEAVSGLDLSVREGEIYAFLGPNGAGKTTTLRSVSGLLSVESGTITVCGLPAGPDKTAFRKKMAYIQDRPYLYEKLSAWEYLQFLADTRRLRGWEDPARSLLKRLRLDERRHHLIEGFSHGMRQKLVLTGAMLHEPRLLLVDEPMVGLDPRSARDVKALFMEMAAAGSAVFLSTHSLDVAQSVAHRIGILKEGRLIAEGTFQALQSMAHEPDSSLEEVFLTLTEEQEGGAALPPPALQEGQNP